MKGMDLLKRGEEMKIEVCSRCRKETCDGKEYRFKDPAYEGFRLCSNDAKMDNEGRLVAHYVMGHGCEWDEEVEAI